MCFRPLSSEPGDSCLSSKRRKRFRYRGALARQLRFDESIGSKIPILLAELGVKNTHDGFVQLALRHVPGFQRSKKAAGKRTIDHATEAQFFELVDDRLREAARTKTPLSPRKAVSEVRQGVPIGHPIRDLSYETLYTYYKQREVREEEYDSAQDELMRPFREKVNLAAIRVDPVEQQKRQNAAVELDRKLGRGNDAPLRRKKRHSPF